VSGHHYTYDDTSSASSACPTGTQANADPANITYLRDATDRIVRRDATAGNTTGVVLYVLLGVR
jgi:hypothetical protein